MTTSCRATGRNPGARIVAPALCFVLFACGGAPPTVSIPAPPEPATTSGGSPSRYARSDEPQPAASATASSAEGAPQEAAPSSEEPSANGPVVELPTGTTILQIGDSFAGALGIDLNRELKEAGVRGVLKYETSTYIPTWASSKDLDHYLWKFHPDLVLITLGANELEIPDPAARAPTIHRLVGRLGGRPCVWVAPPLWQGARPALLDTIRSSCAPCLYLDSSALVPDLQRMKDHIHPAMQARKIWAKAVVDWLRKHRDPRGSRPWDLMP
jgi:lysophospholipase L1-like esterase